MKTQNLFDLFASYVCSICCGCICNQDRMATQPQEITSLHILLACPMSSFLHGPRREHVLKNIQDQKITCPTRAPT